MQGTPISQGISLAWVTVGRLKRTTDIWNALHTNSRLNAADLGTVSFPPDGVFLVPRRRGSVVKLEPSGSVEYTLRRTMYSGIVETSLRKPLAQHAMKQPSGRARQQDLIHVLY